jgi:hypothetical protein
MVSYAVAVVVNHGDLCRPYCDYNLMNQRLGIMMCYTEPVVVNHGVLC